MSAASKVVTMVAGKAGWKVVGKVVGLAEMKAIMLVVH